MLTEAALATFMAALFSMMNPIGNVGVFAGMTADRPDSEAKRIAWTCALAVAITLLIVTWSGPLLLHFFDRRRNVVIEWGAMQFLMEAAAQRTSTRKIKQWLLILLRVLTLLFLILALAQPTLPGSWIGNKERSETIVVLDNSLSMERLVGG